jgi:hypothetical protein
MDLTLSLGASVVARTWDRSVISSGEIGIPASLIAEDICSILIV